MSQLDPAAASPEGSAGLDATGLPRNVENWAKALKHVADHFNVNDLRDAVAVDYVLRAASALPSLIDAKQLADDRGKALAEAAREINCAGTVAHRIRILKQEHEAQLTRNAKADEEVFMANNRTQEDRVKLWRERYESLRLSREQAIAAIEGLPAVETAAGNFIAGALDRSAVLSILRGA